MERKIEPESLLNWISVSNHENAVSFADYSALSELYHNCK